MAENRNLELDLEAGAGEGDEPTARIFIRSAVSYLKEGSEAVISNDCTSIEELESEIARLSHELGSIQKRAQDALGDRAPAPTQPTQVPERGSDGARATLEVRKDLLVSDRMSVPVETIRRSQKISEAAERFQAREIRHLVVLDDDADDIVGMLAERHIVFTALDWAMGQGQSVHEKLTETVHVKDCMQPNVRVVAPGSRLSEAAGLMARNRLDCLPVVAEGDLVGILTEWDFLSLLGDASYQEDALDGPE
jgi:CBS domain-containing membrane protein